MSTFERLCNEYRENKRLIEELNAMNDELKGEIIALMGESDTMTAGAAKATNKTVQSVRFDSAGLKAEYPGIYSKYTRQTSYKRFTVV